MDFAYEKKFAEMKKYIPFLESMIKRLENTGSTERNPRQAQLDKIRSLRDLLLDKKKRMKMDNLLKCEQVLINLYAKVEQKDQYHQPNLVKPAIEKEPTSFNQKSDLETVRHKLKTVTKINECFETLKEVSRADDSETQYTGETETALFERRPKKSSNSPTHSSQIVPIISNSPQNLPKRNYTRVLVSPDRSPRRWSSSEQSSYNKPLFSRRSPPLRPVSPPTIVRKEKKKSKGPRKTKNLNITLNVPQASLKSLDTEDILPRILNCNDDDADIDTLNELRSQILGELKQSGHNKDISNLILQSYKTPDSKKKIKSRTNKEDVEEGELSDSESEAIDSIYGSLSLADKDKIYLTQTKTIEEKDNQQRKIQISLVISDKDSSFSKESSSKQHQIIDLCGKECDNEKDIISVDSYPSPVKKHSTKPIEGNLETTSSKNKMDIAHTVKNINSLHEKQTMSNIIENETTKSRKNNDTAQKTQSENPTECITLDDDIDENPINIETSDENETEDKQLENAIKDSAELKTMSDTAQPVVHVESESINNSLNPDPTQKYDQNPNTDEIRPQFIANFYKPLEEEPVTLDTSNNLPDIQKKAEKDPVKSNTTSNETIISTGELASILSEEVNDNLNVESKVTGTNEDSTTNTRTLEIISNQPNDEAQKIPLLNEPSIQPKANAHVLSEIDILQALKNEILSEPISVPGAEITPTLHQPNVLTKVASAQDILFPKKKISVEAYKEMAPKRKRKARFKYYHYSEARDKKLSLKLTDKECERFQFPKRLSIDDVDDEDEDIDEDDLLNESNEDPDKLYSGLAPKSPDNVIATESGAPPIIIPIDPIKIPTVNSKKDVDMRSGRLPTPQSPLPSLPPPPLPPLVMGRNDVITPSPAFGMDRNVGDIQRVEPNKIVNDTNRFYDPRIRRDTQLSALNSPNSYATGNLERTPRPTYANVASSSPNLTATGAPNMTSGYMHSIPQLMTPNARMTPSHQTFELEELSGRKHIYAPSFSTCDNREKETSVPRDGPHWDMKKEMRNRRSRWDTSNTLTGGPKWEMRDQRGISNQTDTSRTLRNEDAYLAKSSRFDQYNRSRRDSSYSKQDCPMTPVPSFGWSECPSTPGPAFGRQEAPMTPINSFGRSECPSTPSHSFGRTDCPLTPSHPFGRSESIPYGRSDSMNPSNQKFCKDPRLNRRPNECESNFHSDRSYSSERDRKEVSFKPQNKYYTGPDRSRNYEREKSVGRTDKNYGDHKTCHYDRDRRDTSVGRSLSNDYEYDRIQSRDRESRYDGRYSTRYDKYESNQRDRSISSSATEYYERSRARAHGVGRNREKSSSHLNKDDVSFKSGTGRDITINTSVKSTFQELIPSDQSNNTVDNSFDGRRQRAASVGRSLVRENSVGRTLTSVSPTVNRKDQFKRASSVGRETINSKKTLQEVKADFEAFKAKIAIKSIDISIDDSKRGTISTQCNRKKDQNYSPSTNSRDPRMRRDETKSRYKIDRRNDTLNSKKIGIVYSNDNIAKGTIMGAGLAVKNYKIPKIKRPDPEPEPEPTLQSKADDKKSEKECIEAEPKSDFKKNHKHTDKNPESKSIEISKTIEPDKAGENKIINDEKTKFKKVDETEGRITRSRKKNELKDSRDATDDTDIVTKTRKPKKPNVILDSESESEDKSNTKNSPVNSPIQNRNKKTNKNLQNKTTEMNDEIDKDIFSENVSPDSPKNEINALIAKLDSDIENSKDLTESFVDNLHTFDTDKNSPETSLVDISEVIEKDLSENKIKVQKENISANILIHRDISEAAHQDSHPMSCHHSDLITEQNADETIKSHVDNEIILDKSQPCVSKDMTSDDNTVSTTEIDSIPKNSADLVANIDGQSAPDSTLKKRIVSKTLPDSTNDELSSDVTSTENDETSYKDADVSRAKEPLNEIGSILSILKDKSKIKELLSMLGEQSNSDNDKIKKKLEKLSQIVSDEEDDEDETEFDVHKDKNNVGNIKTIDNISQSENIKAQSDEEVNNIAQSSKEILPTSKIDKDVETTHIIPDLGKIDETGMVNTNMHNVEIEPNVENTCITTNEKTLDFEIQENSDGTKTKQELSNSNLSANTISATNDKSDKTSDENKMSEDDEPLVKKGIKKNKATKVIGKIKRARKNKLAKRLTRANTGKSGIKKKGELQKLQEDLQEMFMNTDILNATGIRMCRLAKMGNEKESVDSESVLESEKVKELQKQEQPLKIRKKPGPKPKVKGARKISLDEEKKQIKTKSGRKNKIGPKSKTKSENTDPFEFDTDSIADTSTTKDSDGDSSDSETASLASSRSFGSSEVLTDTKKKQKRKRRGIGGWQAGIIKPKKKKDKTQESLKPVTPAAKPHKPFNIPDLHCFTDKSYCFEKGVSTYDCRLCIFSGKEIVKHFKEQHPHTEIPLSRLDEKTAELAITQCEETNYLDLINVSTDKYICRFCHKEFAYSSKVLETFFWHVVTNHTGEFKHLCPECVNVTRCPFNLDIPPPPKDGGQLLGYICKKCNFIQISLKNLKTHVVEQHRDEETEVFTINLAVMSNKAMKTMLKRAQSNKNRVKRSLRSNHSTLDTSDTFDEHSDASGSSVTNSQRDTSISQAPTKSTEEPDIQTMVQESKPRKNKLKLSFEDDEPSDDMSVKIEQDNSEANNQSSRFDDALVTTAAAEVSHGESRDRNSGAITDYAHFKLNYTTSGAKEYVCCINGNDGHYKTSLLISMKKHIQSKHSEKWDGYCCVCKVLVTLQGVQTDFKDCLAHFHEKHMDDFPVLEKVAESTNLIANVPEPAVRNVVSEVQASLAPSVAAEISPAIPARVATPPVERTASPSYIAVRPMAELLSRDLVRQIEETPNENTSMKSSLPLPKIECVVSLGEDNAPAAQANPVYPSTGVSAPASDRPFLYEEVQALVMSQKHRVVLDAMMSKENLVRVFKCAGRFCSFSSDSVDEALMHASAHQRVGGEGALQCAYCNHDAGRNGIDLVMHVFKEHSRCQYCCPACFYRAAAPQLVEAHHARAHAAAGALQAVLHSAAPPPAAAPPAAALLARDRAVPHYICKHDDGSCSFKTYIPRKFTEHIEQKHPNATSHPCNHCESAPATAGELVVHLRSHGLRLYQCTWCVHGASDEQALLAHGAASHPDRAPQAYVRCTTLKDGGQRVLPLAILNKFNVATECVVAGATEEDPTKAAERSIDLERLIGHTTMMTDTSTNLSASENTEEPFEIQAEILEEHDDDEPSPLESLITSEVAASEPETPQATDSTIATEIDTVVAVIKPELPEVANTSTSSEVICLDSDEEGHTTEPVSFVPAEDISHTDEQIEITPERVSRSASSSSVADEVSKTKVTEDNPEKGSEEPKDQVTNSEEQNVIALSDEEYSAQPVDSDATAGVEMIKKKSELFKCPACMCVRASAHLLKTHAEKQCAVGVRGRVTCPHAPCRAEFADLTRLIAHYNRGHRSKNQNVCGVCRGSFTTLVGVKVHIRKHGVTNYEVQKDKTDSGTRYMVVPATLEPLRSSSRKTSTEIQRYAAEVPPARSRKAEPRKRYGVADIDKLPISPILDAPVHCAECEFSTKVRLNMVRHLQAHAERLPAPTQPVNPVPHLGSNEKHFDKMVNLASSSLAPAPPPAERHYPRYVADKLRYACGAHACSYISVDAAMFRRHWETLHAAERSYCCVHCPPHQALDTSVALSAARILAHLRMHDACLYACSACQYYHYSRAAVERHAADAHRVPANVRTVRDQAPPAPAPAPSPAPAGAPTMDLKRWRCGLCDFCSMLRPNLVEHCASVHHSKMQYKCSYCAFRTSALENVTKHQANAHPTEPKDVFYYFYKEGSVPEEADGAPLWQKQRQKQGISELKTEPEPAGPAGEPAAPPGGSSLVFDLNIVKEERPEEGAPGAGTELSVEQLCDKFGEFCEPDGLKYKCCLCGAVREYARDTMQGHLYEELNYRRWECVICSYKAFHKTGLNEHMASEHSRQFNEPIPLPVDFNIEAWVQAFLNHQAKTIECNMQNLSTQKIQGEIVPLTPAARKPESPKAASNASDEELQNAFGEFGSPKNQHYACPKCDYVTKDEGDMVSHLESELSKIRWGCTSCSGKYTTFHEAQFHGKSSHTPPGRPKEAIRDPSLRNGWVKAVVESQKQFINCISASRELSPEQENSLLVAMYDEPVQIDERATASGASKRPAPADDSDDERLIIAEPPAKKPNDRQCSFCDYAVNNSRYLREHILVKHYKMMPYQCSYCVFEGSRPSVSNHLNLIHADRPKKLFVVQIPSTLPPEGRKTKDPESQPSQPVASSSKRDSEEVTKKVCLYCEKTVPEHEMESHTHGAEKAEFAKRGEVVVKCCKCLVLRLSVASLQEHFDACHPGDKVVENYAYFKLQVDTREIYCCGHCYKKFKFSRDLKAHHAATHTSLSLSYTSIPFSHNLHTEGDYEMGKRRLEHAAAPSPKRVALKSTSKPHSPFAKKSTTKLPHWDESREYSFYGQDPAPLTSYNDVTVHVPTQNSRVEMNVNKVANVINIEPKVVLKDYKC